MEACSGELLPGLRKREELPAEAVSVLISLDGVMRMNAETADGKATDAGWREAPCGVVALVDAEGIMLESRYFGRLPEAGKAGLKSQLKAEAFHWTELNRALKLAVVADAAPDKCWYERIELRTASPRSCLAFEIDYPCMRFANWAYFT